MKIKAVSICIAIILLFVSSSDNIRYSAHKRNDNTQTKKQRKDTIDAKIDSVLMCKEMLLVELQKTEALLKESKRVLKVAVSQSKKIDYLGAEKSFEKKINGDAPSVKIGELPVNLSAPIYSDSIRLSKKN